MPPTASPRDPIGGLLDAIAAEVARRAAGAEAEIMAWYLAGVAQAMRHMSRNDLAAVLRALKAERAIRLAAVRHNAATERRARQQAALRNHHRLRLCPDRRCTSQEISPHGLR